MRFVCGSQRQVKKWLELRFQTWNAMLWTLWEMESQLLVVSFFSEAVQRENDSSTHQNGSKRSGKNELYTRQNGNKKNGKINCAHVKMEVTKKRENELYRRKNGSNEKERENELCTRQNGIGNSNQKIQNVLKSKYSIDSAILTHGEGEFFSVGYLPYVRGRVWAGLFCLVTSSFVPLVFKYCKTNCCYRFRLGWQQNTCFYTADRQTTVWNCRCAHERRHCTRNNFRQ